MSEVPLVCLLDDIAPDDMFTAGPLTYHSGRLASAALRYEQMDGALMSDLWTPDKTSVQYAHAASNAASAYLVRTAHRATAASTQAQRDLWSERYTQASIEFYGQPDPTEAKRLIHTKQRKLIELQSYPLADQRQVDYLLNFYTSIAGDPDPSSTTSSIDTSLWPEIAAVMNERYSAIFELLDNTAVGKDVLTTEEYAPIFVNAVKWLAQNDNPEWANWKVVKRPGGFAVYQETKEIIVGANPAGLPRLRIKTLLAHELLSHALRSVTAYAMGDYNLALGLPGYDAFEEGKATLLGWAVSGKFTEGAIDFYTDIAIARGSIDGRPRSRDDLLAMSRARAIINAQTEEDGLVLDNNGMQRVLIRGNQQVNRIFRGGGLLTKDIVYYDGYDKAYSFIRRLRAYGISMGGILDYLKLGGFDPELDMHRDHVLEVTGKKLWIPGNYFD